MQKILLIEDDKTISQLVAKNLINWGYQVQEVKDFQMVLEQMEEFQPHLILLDIGLPFSMAITGVRKFARHPVCPLCFYLPMTSQWILLWRSIWGRMTM